MANSGKNSASILKSSRFNSFDLAATSLLYGDSTQPLERKSQDTSLQIFDFSGDTAELVRWIGDWSFMPPTEFEQVETPRNRRFSHTFKNFQEPIIMSPNPSCIVIDYKIVL